MARRPPQDPYAAMPNLERLHAELGGKILEDKHSFGGGSSAADEERMVAYIEAAGAKGVAA